MLRSLSLISRIDPAVRLRCLACRGASSVVPIAGRSKTGRMLRRILLQVERMIAFLMCFRHTAVLKFRAAQNRPFAPISTRDIPER
jgi:hypothetical protein